jgi:signal transduction histidine kinase
MDFLFITAEVDMNSQEVLRFYENVLSAFEHLDHMYYCDPRPSDAQRAAYHQRQAIIAGLRAHISLALDSAGGPDAEDSDTSRILVNDSEGHSTISEPKCRLSHELKNCLHIILASAEMLSSRISNDHEALLRIRDIVRTVQRMKGRINNSRCRVLRPGSMEQLSTQSEPNENDTA